MKTLSVFFTYVVDSAVYTSTIKSEGIFASPWHQFLRERATVLLYSSLPTLLIC
jgi:hypothetical protein